MTARQDLIVRQGETWSFVWTKRDTAGVAVDLTGYTARMAVKHSYSGSSEAHLSTGDDARGGSISLGGGDGTVTLAMTAAQSAVLASGVDSVLSALWGEPAETDGPTVVYRYDLELVSGAGAVTRELEGRFIVHREVTA